jgi:hypothetical protein
MASKKTKKFDKDLDIKEAIKESKILEEINNSDFFHKENPELIPIYMSANKYMFYQTKNMDRIYKVCQKTMYTDIDHYLLKKEELSKQISEILHNSEKAGLNDCIEHYEDDDMVWFSSPFVKNIRTLFNPENIKIFEWNELKPFMENLIKEFEDNYINRVKVIFSRDVDYDLNDNFRFQEYAKYINSQLSNFGIVLSPEFPEKLKNMFPKDLYRLNKNLTTENTFLNDSLQITFIDPVFIEESIPYLYAEYVLISENIDNKLWGTYSRWTKFIKDYFRPMIEKNKKIQAVPVNSIKFYKAIRLVEKANLFLLRDHEIAIYCLKEALKLFSELDVKFLSMGIIAKKNKEK